MQGLMGKRKFTFVNYGGSYQLRIERAEDLVHLDDLDDPFWMATSAPIDQLRCDRVALEHLDVNRNGRIISGELRRTRRWLFAVLRDLQGVTEGRDLLRLEDVDEAHEDGAKLLAAAHRILANLDRPGSPTISLAEIRDTKSILAKGAVNGDGIIPPRAVSEPELRSLLQDVARTVGTVEGVDGGRGVDAARLDRFVAEAEALLAWRSKATEHETRDLLLPLGEETPAGHELLERLRGPIERYFKLCALLQLNESLGRRTAEPTSPATAYTSEDELQRYLELAPVAPPNAAGELRLDAPLNPHYARDLRALLREVIQPLRPAARVTPVLTREGWDELLAVFAPYEQWLATKAGAEVEPLGLRRLRAILDSDLPARARAMMDGDLAVGKELAAVRDLERLVLMQRWLLELCNNFISFRNMYEPSLRSIFEIGRLVIDGRSFHFNLRVANVDAHKVIAARSGMFLLYSEVSASPSDEAFTMVTPVTSRDRGNLGIDKRGVLLDLDGRQWEVRVVAVVENPISLGEAIAAPFRRMSNLLTSAVDRLSTRSEKQLETTLSKATGSVEDGVLKGMKRPAEPPPKPEDPPPPAPPEAAPAPPSLAGRTRDVLLTGGVTIAAIGSSLAFITRTLADLQLTRTLTAIAIGLLVVLVPVVLVALLKLYRRNLSAILEASGWAINARLRLTRGLAKMLAPDPVHPESFERLRRDLIRQALGTKAQRARALR
ncbi:MAG: hypothetical protein H6712_08985 [Myxococcales bacterium]|nr:hypothetical protein [Myxococcales bacterium]